MKRREQDRPARPPLPEHLWSFDPAHYGCWEPWPSPAWHEAHEQHRAEVRAWCQKYGTNPLELLRERQAGTHRREPRPLHPPQEEPRMIETAVPLTEVAKLLKTTVPKLEAEARVLSMFVGEDWAGQPAVSATDACALRTGAARAQQQQEAAWSAHLKAADAWEAEREQLVADAARQAYDDALRRGEGNPKAAEEGQAAAVEVGRRFESSNPPPLFDGKPGAASRRFAAETPGLVRRVADRVVAAVSA